MSLRMLHGETELEITLTVTDYESANNVDISTSTDFVFYLKSDPTMDDNDAEYSVSNGSDLTFSGDTMKAKINDWSQLKVDTTYHMGFGFKLAGDTNYREIKIKKPENRTIQFEQDVIRS